jgi:hypothetical protein
VARLSSLTPGYFISRLQREERLCLALALAYRGKNRALPDGRASAPVIGKRATTDLVFSVVDDVIRPLVNILWSRSRCALEEGPRYHWHVFDYFLQQMRQG